MPGQGTAFTMKFPTSLAIQSAMIVRVGDQPVCYSNRYGGGHRSPG